MGSSQSSDGAVNNGGSEGSNQPQRRSLSHASSQRRQQVHGKTPPNPTSAALVAAASTSTSTTTAQGISASPKHSRARSVTTTAPELAPHDVSSSHKSDTAPTMGNNESKPQPRPPSRSNTLPTHAGPPRKAPPTTQELKETASPATQPVEVPPLSSDGQEDDFIPGFSESPYGLPPANYSRPPRLPLPIEEEVHTPGSPIITPQDVEGAVTQLDSSEIEGGDIPRKNSVLSSTYGDDDDIGDNEAFAAESSQWGEIRVPTEMEWNGHGDKVFVTGTFCNWEKKIKLHKKKDGHGFAAIVQLPPGTHHIKFLVDGEMMTSENLPTTVDWTNSLVNYVEIVAPLPSDGKQAPGPAAPMPIPGAAITAGQAVATPEPASHPTMHVSETEKTIPSMQEAVGPRGERAGSVEAPVPTPAPASQRSPEAKPKAAATKQKLPRPKYTNQIPEFLVDLDNYSNPEDERFQRAQRVSATLPQPPSLPMFLSKSILNGATPHKDDASVLVLPNHTVLNHLATSSIKSGVLATSGTTRYKRKFLTTIMYKPTSDDG
ncbi:carbohydrate-binding module family 48 protein [Zasmidium cellare ATCC 36951]|uniref:Carbohydrate-binding module family 48 protein n=1 Tax=Zasmidium cellare ATCC 36951 TaxID=1080233 RepID=A0A6A6CVP0_ZASCE|nr:carbohydrate-binding module family 48 protein [Zasmidium cellare ATCC 36951]KAF2171105.1 carbohydrate-binding module family 48 protein [Zasmidium cellare ATCC 36951]